MTHYVSINKIKLYAKYGENMNHCNCINNNVLCAHHDPDIINCFLEHGVDVFKKNISVKTVSI